MNYQEYLNENNPKIELTVKNYGTIKLELFPSVAPITVKNFLKLVNEGFYTNLTFHRVISPPPRRRSNWGQPNGMRFTKRLMQQT